MVSQPTGLIDKSGGFQDTRYGLFVQHHNVDEAQSLTVSKCESISSLCDAFRDKLCQTVINSKNIL